METNQTAPEAGPVPEDAQGDSASAGPQAEGAAGSAPADTAGSTGGTASDASGDGFYAWLRRLGVPRRPGWLGGVCAGVAARLGIDPIIVRGIVVVAAVLGAPFVLIYAIAWLLLPDTDGQIQLERLTRGIVDPAIVGIAVMGVIGLIPLVQGGWFGWRWWPDLAFADPIFGIDLTWPLRVLWVLIVIAAIIAGIIWLVRRGAATSAGSPPAQSSPGGGGPRMASASTAYPGNPSASSATDAPATATTGTLAFSAAVASAVPAPAPATEPPVPAEGADAAAIAEWRAQHEAWRVSHTEWKAGQAEADRAARARAAFENKVKAQELTAHAEAGRAARRASRPRTSAAYVVTVLGVALIGGAIAALRALDLPDIADFAIPIALAVVTITLAAGMLIAALRRRRAGFLAFTAIVATVSMLIAAIGASIMPQGSLVPPGYGISLDHSQRLVQPIGDAFMYAFPTVGTETPVVELTQGVGDTWLTVDENALVLLDATDAGALQVYTVSAGGVVTQVPLGGERVLLLGGDDPVNDDISSAVDVRLVLNQGTGTVRVEINEGA